MNATPHILIVDDSAEIRNAVARYLEKNGMRVTRAADATEMDGKLAVGRYDLIVLDLMMPGEDGLSVCRRLSPRRIAPILMLTALGEEMQDMVERTLAFARGMATSETPETIELGRFLGRLNEDMLDAFDLEPGPEVVLRVRPHALRRALRNVIENALRYGGDATVRYEGMEGEAVIEVRDTGPGIHLMLSSA